MGEHEPSVGHSDEWYTPPEILEAIGESYDLDPCSPGSQHWVPAKKVLTIHDNGLRVTWDGFVFVNPPYGGRNSHVPWLEKFIKHGNGIGVFRAYTSAGWFHDWAIQADCLLFPRGKTKFIRPDGSIGKAPGHGVVLLGMGERAGKALSQSGLGLFIKLKEAK